MAKQNDTTKHIDAVVLLLSNGKRVDDAKRLCQDKFKLTVKQASRVVEKAVDRIKRNSDVCIEWELGKTIELYDNLFKETKKTTGDKRLTAMRLQRDILKDKAGLLITIRDKFYNDLAGTPSEDICALQLESLGNVFGLEIKGVPVAESIRRIEISALKIITENERLKRASSKLRNSQTPGEGASSEDVAG